MSYKDTELTLGLPGEGSRGYSPVAKDQVVGWPPVRSTRNKDNLDSKNSKNTSSSSRYVKVGADGAPYLRKVDLEMYTSYEELLTALQNIFTSCIINGKYMEDDRKQEGLVMKHAAVNEIVEYNQYVLAYEDTDNDWMLVGDVPWKMFKDSCKRIRLMKSSDSVVRN